MFALAGDFWVFVVIIYGTVYTYSIPFISFYGIVLFNKLTWLWKMTHF